MPKITVLPHPEFAPDGASFDVPENTSVCDALLEHGVEIDHACGKVSACTTCHVYITQGFNSLNPPEEKEEDMLDRAWGLQANSRLSCQAIVTDVDLEVEIPRYSINQVRENG